MKESEIGRTDMVIKINAIIEINAVIMKLSEKEEKDIMNDGYPVLSNLIKI